jgi:hypothetical protein
MGFQARPGARRRAALALRAVDLRSKRHHPPPSWSMLREAAGAGGTAAAASTTPSQVEIRRESAS